MPELPDVTIYVERLRALAGGHKLTQLRLASPFVLRSVTPPVEVLENKQLTGVGRLGKRIILELESEFFAVIHLMLAGRLRWRGPGAKIPRTSLLAAFEFDVGTLLFTATASHAWLAVRRYNGSVTLTMRPTIVPVARPVAA